MAYHDARGPSTPRLTHETINSKQERVVLLFLDGVLAGDDVDTALAGRYSREHLRGGYLGFAPSVRERRCTRPAHIDSTIHRP